MENVFESVLGASTPDTQSDDAVESTNNTSELGEEYNLTLPEDTDAISEDEGSDDTRMKILKNQIQQIKHLLK